MNVLLLCGTWGEDDDWHRHDGRLANALRSGGHIVLDEPDDWDGALDGVLGRNDDWEAAGKSIARQYAGVSDLCIIAHSHGGQVAAIACREGLHPDKLVTVSTPVRGDMKAEYKAAQMATQEWVHVRSDCSDWWQVLGALFDKRIGIYRDMPLADENIYIPGIGHSGALTPEILLPLL